jgi:hypothetical protein
MDFDSLFNYCTKLNDSTSEKCLVCHIPIENNDVHLKLKCNHLFHLNCINYKKGSVNCLYCEKTSIPIIIPNKNNLNSSNNLQKEIYCKVILKSGPNKSEYCNRISCKYHKIQSQTIFVINPVTKQKIKPKKEEKKKEIKITKCTFILKSGKQIGSVCCRDLPCKYHINKINNVNNEIKKIDNFTIINIIEDHIENNEDDLIEI